jgi:hypothetical protein
LPCVVRSFAEACGADAPSAAAGTACAGGAPAPHTDGLSTFEVDVAHAYVGAQLVLTVPLIPEGFAEPAPGLSIAITIHIANAGAGMNKTIS